MQSNFTFECLLPTEIFNEFFSSEIFYQITLKQINFPDTSRTTELSERSVNASHYILPYYFVLSSPALDHMISLYNVLYHDLLYRRTLNIFYYSHHKLRVNCFLLYCIAMYRVYYHTVICIMLYYIIFHLLYCL